MGSGTIGFRELPKRKLKIYGDEDFHLRPKGCCDEEYHFAIRPVFDKQDLQDGYIWMIEGEFGMGASSLRGHRAERNRGEYKNTRYVYYPCDYDQASPAQRKVMEKWAIDGSI
jgi:hypothetical protein